MSKNKNTKFITKFLKKNLISIALSIIAVMAIGCSMIGGFNRSTAAGLIEKDKRYTAAAAMTIDIGGRIANASADTPQKSANETVEEAAIRVREDFMQKQPQLFVAENLGYIKLHFEDGELGERTMGAPRFDNALQHWYFKARAEVTDKGRSLWKALNLTADEKSLPLAIRGTPDVTGLKDENPNMKSGDFTYKWEPNDLGKAFDPNGEEFKQLPPNLQETLKKNQYNPFGGSGNNTMDFKTLRKGRAIFQKFDDGWRLNEIYFM